MNLYFSSTPADGFVLLYEALFGLDLYRRDESLLLQFAG
jgi:hypothetical protein